MIRMQMTVIFIPKAKPTTHFPPTDQFFNKTVAIERYNINTLRLQSLL